MAYTLKTMLVILCFVFTGVFCANATETIRKSLKVNVSTALPPQARTVGTVGLNSSSNRNQWLDIDLKFRTSDEKNRKKRFFDDVELEVQVATYKEKDNVLFKGKINYYYIEKDGKEHYMKALLPAPLFNRYVAERSIDRTAFVVKASLKVGGRLVAVGFGSNKSLDTKEIQSYFKALPRGIVQVENSVFGRNGTTWSIIEVNKYEFEKVK